MRGFILVGDINRSFQGKGVELPVYYFFHGYFVGVELLALWRYIHVVEEGPDEGLSGHTESPACKRDVM